MSHLPTKAYAKIDLQTSIPVWKLLTKTGPIDTYTQVNLTTQGIKHLPNHER